MQASTPILIVDDDLSLNESLIRALATYKIQNPLYAAQEPTNALLQFEQLKPGVVILDLALNPIDGVESGYLLLQKFLSIDRHCRIVVLTGNSQIPFGIRALNLGAAHFIAKPANLGDLTTLIKDCNYQYQLRKAADKTSVLAANNLEQIIVGVSSSAQRLREQILFASQTTQSVFIRGETGTGKGLCAEAIHALSKRQTHPLIRYQPTFSSNDLTNSDLFGHQKGSFTGALLERKGLLSEANSGTLFLDEIDCLPAESQVALLGTLHNGCYRSLGDNREKRSDFRLISASNAIIEECITRGTFRRDLFYRIAQLQIALPALKERLQDIPHLCAHILKKLKKDEHKLPSQLSKDSLSYLMTLPWPGNIRELESVIENAALMACYQGHEQIEVDDLKSSVITAPVNNNNYNADFHQQVSNFEKSLVTSALIESGGSLTAAARRLNIDRGTVRRIIERSG